MMMMEFQTWIRQKYIEWSKGSKSESQFAVYLGISQASLNAWFNGIRGKPTSPKIVNRLIRVYGDEVYDVLGLDRPGESASFESLPTDFRRRLAEADREILRRRADLNLTNPDSPEVLAIASEVFEKYGFKVTIKE